MSYEKAAVIAAVNKVAAGLAAKVIAELDAPKFKDGAIYVNKVYREGHNHPFMVSGSSIIRSDGRVVAIAGMKEKFEDFVEVTSFCSCELDSIRVFHPLTRVWLNENMVQRDKLRRGYIVCPTCEDRLYDNGEVRS